MLDRRVEQSPTAVQENDTAMSSATTRRSVIATGWRHFVLALVIIGCADEVGKPRVPIRITDLGVRADSIIAWTAGEELPISLRVEAADGSPVRDAFLKWTTTNTGAGISEATSVTAENGGATAKWRLGTKVAEEQQLQVNVFSPDGRNASLQLHARTLPGAPVELHMSADTAILRVGDTTRMTFSARDRFGNEFVPDSVTTVARDTLVARPVAHGQLAILGRGTTPIIAHAGSATDSGEVNAIQVVRAIMIDPDTLRFYALDVKRTVAVRVIDERGLEVKDSVPAIRVSDTSVTRLLDTLPLVVTSQRAGIARIRLQAGSVQRDLIVEVGQATAVVDVAPVTVRFNSLGDTARLHAAVLDSGSSPIIGAAVTFTSADNGIAFVDGMGLVTARANGMTRIAVTSSGVTDSITVRVAQRPARLALTSDTLTFNALNATAPVPVRVLDSLGNTIQGSPVTTTPATQGVVAVTIDGSLKALKVGTTSLTVRNAVDSVRLSALVRQRPSHIAIDVDTVVDALNEKVLINAMVLDSLGSVIPGAVPRFTISDSAIAAIRADTLVSLSNGSTWVSAAADGLETSVPVRIAQVAARIELRRTDSLVIASLRQGDLLPVACSTYDHNDNPIPATPTIAPSRRGLFAGSTCGTLTAAASGIDTLRASVGTVSATLPLAFAIRPTTGAARATQLQIDGIPAGRYPWSPTLRRRTDGRFELYAALYDSLSWLSGDLHRFVSSDGVSFQHDQLILAHDTTRCSLASSGIENVAVLPQTDGPGTRLYFAAGSFECYGWQVFSAVSADDATWTVEAGARVPNGGTIPPNAPVYAPWPVGEGMDIVRLSTGEWQMLVGGYEHVTPYDDKFQIIEWRSSNQLDWRYVGPALTTRSMPAGGQSTIYSPTTREFAPGLYRMVFAGDNRGVPGSRGRIWTALSTDRVHWQLEGELLGDESVSYYYASLVDDRLITIMLPIGAPLPEGHLATVTVAMP